MNSSEYLSVVGSIHEEARRRGVFFQVVEGETLRGRTIQLGGRELTSFASCSYLGLEFHPALEDGVVDAVHRYGTQFSSSRGYLSAPPYRELEARLGELFGGFAMVTSSTSLGHQSVLPALATEKDAIVLDNQAHHSMQTAATLAQARGATVETVRHRELDDRALDTLDRLARRHRTVYFCCDGVYSMYGDFAPFGLLRKILDVAPNVRLYVDDAHGMSWAGEHGRGLFLSRMPISERIVLGTSLNKAFSAGGGCFVFATEEERERVRITGAPYVFSGPLQPPMLGAALASAGVHLSDEIVHLQRRFQERARLCNTLCAQHGLPLLARNDGPIFFIQMGNVEGAITVAERMLDEGFFVSLSAYPSVPTRRAGIRLTLTSLHTPGEVRDVVAALGYHVPLVLDEQGITREELDSLYADALPRESRGEAPEVPVREPRRRVKVFSIARAPQDDACRVETASTIHDLDREEWNSLMGAMGASSWEALALAEEVFRDNPRPEHNWRWRYFIARRPDGRPVLATYATHAVTKDDIFLKAEVSEEIERRRAAEPYYLCSEVWMLGSMFSEGHHLYLDRAGPWRDALSRVIGALRELAIRDGAPEVVLRDFDANDPEVDAWMRAHDFLKVPILDSHRLVLADVPDDDAMVARVGPNRRRFLRRLMENAPAYRATVFGAHGEPLPSGDFAKHLHGLYLNVATRKRRINVFPMPERLIAPLFDNPSWEVVTLAPSGEPDALPVSWYCAHHHGGEYSVFMVGIDYAHVEGLKYGAYRQLILHMIRRAREVGAKILHIGMDADREKERFGTRADSTCIYFQGLKHDHGEHLADVIASVGLGQSAGV